MSEEDAPAPLGPLQCGHRGCPSEAAWKPLVLVFLTKQVFGLPSPVGLRPRLRRFYVCARHRRDVACSDVFGEDGLERLVTVGWICGTTLVVDRAQTRLEWEEV